MRGHFIGTLNGRVPNGVVDELAWDFVKDDAKEVLLDSQLPLRNIREETTLELVAEAGLFVVESVKKAAVKTIALRNEPLIARASFTFEGALTTSDTRISGRGVELRIVTEGGSADHYYIFKAMGSFSIL